MKQITLHATERARVGRGPSRRLRKTGQIPAVIYGPNGLRHLTLTAPDFQQLWKEAAGRATLIELKVAETDPQWAILREIQRDPRTDRFVHVDLQEIERGKEMTIDIMVRTTGDAFGVRNQDGVIDIQSHEVQVRCRPRDLPEIITVDITELKVGDSVHIRELPELEGVTYLDDPDLVVVACVGKMAEDEVEAAEEVVVEGAESDDEEASEEKEEKKED